MHRETSAASVWLSRRSAFSSSSACLPPQPPSLCHLLLFFLFLSESWFHLTWQSCGSYGRRCYKCSVTTLNMAGTALQCSLGRGGGKKSAKVLCLATACLTSTFISHFQLQPANCSASTPFCWPRFDAGEGEWAGGGRLSTREGEGERWIFVF